MLLIVLTYFAGVLTILSPCILPVLPFVFSRAQGSFLKSGVPLLLGMSLTFSFFSAIAIVGGEWVAHANEIGRILAMILLSVFGLSLVFPHFSEKLLAPLTQAGSDIGRGSKQDSFWGSFVIGISTGLLWAPCAGPILGLVLTGAATRGSTGASIALLFSYSLGAATSLAIALVAGNKFLGTLKKFLGVDRVVKKTLGVLVLLGVVVIAFHLDQTLLIQLSKFETANFENKLLSMVQPEKSDSSAVMPEIAGDTGWINSQPLLKKDLVGKVVLIDFWTYSCINCLRTLPYVKALAAKYKNNGLIVIGVHTPEFAFEKLKPNVEKAVKDLGITYPVVLDSDYKIWNSFENKYWPAHYFIDAKGFIRGHHFGEGDYEGTEKQIRDLLIESGQRLDDEAAAPVSGQGIQATSSPQSDQSPETYVGYARATHFASTPSASHDVDTVYTAPKTLNVNEWALDGKWVVLEEKAIPLKPNGKLLYRFRARDLHLVLGGEKMVKFKVTVDGHAPAADHGLDTNENGEGQIDSHRLYQLLRLKNGETMEHTFEIEFLDSGAEVYAFTFG